MESWYIDAYMGKDLGAQCLLLLKTKTFFMQVAGGIGLGTDSGQLMVT